MAHQKAMGNLHGSVVTIEHFIDEGVLCTDTRGTTLVRGTDELLVVIKEIPEPLEDWCATHTTFIHIGKEPENITGEY